jgi:catechol 2,3-dioxygenase-like lactoylglutathione lyase family enzyme
MKLDCVFYYVTDLDRAVEFYSQTLGLTLVSRDVVARFRLDGLLFELVPTAGHSRRSGEGNARVTFEVLDIRKEVEALRRKGVSVGGIERVSNGLLASLADPDGNELVLWQYATGRRERPEGAGEKIRIETEPPDAQDYHDLFETTGWNAEYRATPGDLDRANRNSWYVVSAYDADRLVAFGRVVSDGVLHAMVYDMIVRPEFQRAGLGSRVLSMLVARCREANIPDVQLFCARGKKAFYLRHGFEPRPDDAPGMQLREGA